MRILLALDGSECSAAAPDALIAQIKTRGTEVRVLHAVEPFPLGLAEKEGSKGSPDFLAARRNLKKRSQEIVAQAADKLRVAGFKVTSSVEEGDARDVILDLAESWRADLIILGSHGRKGWGRFLMGSVSEAVAHHATCSVEIVRVRPAR